MTRKYTSKETKSLIDKHNEILKRLDAVSLLQPKFKIQIQNCVNNLCSTGVFSNDVMDLAVGWDGNIIYKIYNLL